MWNKTTTYCLQLKTRYAVVLFLFHIFQSIANVKYLSSRVYPLDGSQLKEYHISMITLEKVKELRDRKLTYSEIGNILGCSKQRIHQIYKNYEPSLFYNEEKKLALERDNFTCQVCGKKKNIQVHHIDRKKYSHNFNYLITLCSKCHGITHKLKNA